MPITTADDIRTRIATPLTSEQLDAKYGLVQGLITTAADEGRYSVTVTLGADEADQFKTWIRGYGYRAVASDTAGTQIRKLVGDAANVQVTWGKITTRVYSQQVVRGNAVYVNLTSVGVTANTEVYWRITGTITAGELLENTLSGTVTLGSDHTAAITVNVQPTATVGASLIVSVYWDSFYTDLAVTAQTVAITA
jgi:hypothetical protein